MGIIILPFLFGALLLGIFAIVKSIQLKRSKTIGLKEIIFGLATSIFLFGLISFSYMIEGKSWALSPAFRIPIFMVFIPFAVYRFTENSKNLKAVYFSKILLISIGVTAILGVIFNDVFFGLIDHLGIKKNY